MLDVSGEFTRKTSQLCRSIFQHDGTTQQFLIHGLIFPSSMVNVSFIYGYHTVMPQVMFVGL